MTFYDRKLVRMTAVTPKGDDVKQSRQRLFILVEDLLDRVMTLSAMSVDTVFLIRLHVLSVHLVKVSDCPYRRHCELSVRAVTVVFHHAAVARRVCYIKIIL